MPFSHPVSQLERCYIILAQMLIYYVDIDAKFQHIVLHVFCYFRISYVSKI